MNGGRRSIMARHREAPVWLWLALGALVLLGGGGAAVAIYGTTRGLRNNNPGNIRKDGKTVWQGMATAQPDASFVSFVSPEYGIRALAKVLHTYIATGTNTIRAIVTRWAPPSENNTAAYIAAVAAQTGINPDAPVNEATHLPALVQAIIKHENGVQPYPPDVLARGLALA